jgi:histidine ammonia-lyase
VRVRMTETAVASVVAGRNVVQAAIDRGEPIYGVTTGFGSMSGTTVSPAQQAAIQPRILRSHAVGSGDALPEEVVRASMLLKAHTLAQGRSGVRPELVEQLLAFLNQRIHPHVPEQGSVGASGDLAPLAHLALPLIGEGMLMTHDGITADVIGALRAQGLGPLTLHSKEASSLTNGTEVSLGLATLGLVDAERVVGAAELAAALSFAALRGHVAAFDERIHRTRPHVGQTTSAARLRHLVSPAAEPRRPVHDVYSLRCLPQVIGPVRDAVRHARETIEVEIGAVTDNPLVFAESGEIVSGGNFHGHALALACDSLKLAVASLGVFSERRIASLIDGSTSGLPHLLVDDPSVNSGFMVAQYAAASIASENKTLSHPASVDSISTAGGTEDYNSMSATAARHLRRVVANVRRIVAIEITCAAQALDYVNDVSAPAIVAAHTRIRQDVEHVADDAVPLHRLIDGVEALIRGGDL